MGKNKNGCFSFQTWSNWHTIDYPCEKKASSVGTKSWLRGLEQMEHEGNEVERKLYVWEVKNYVYYLDYLHLTDICPWRTG